MFLGKWADGIGQILAPDKNYVPPPETEDTRSGFWYRLAPDPRFAPEGATSSQGPRSQARAGQASPAFKSPHSRYQKHQKLNATPDPSASGSASVLATPNTPVIGSSRTPIYSPELVQVEGLVMDTVMDVARTMRSAVSGRKPENDVLAFCCNTTVHTTDKMKKKQEKARARIKKILENDPGIFQARSCELGNNPPDGYTPLMAAAQCNNLEAAKLLWETASPDSRLDQLLCRNFQGKTSFHIASERGHLEMVAFLQDKHVTHFGSLPPIDLMGCTPYGAAMTSPDPKARKNRTELTKMLYAANDVSILGSPSPVQHRIQSSGPGPLQLVYGFADMPGKRITMEDAMVAALWGRDKGSASAATAALFGVCDGHADCGRVSEYIAQEFPSAFKSASTMKGNWVEKCEDIFLSIDAKLEETGLVGGSTAVLALVTPDEIVVANVGDSRCIFIQSKSTGLEEQLEQLTLEEKGKEKKDPPSSNTPEPSSPSASPPPSSSWNDYIVVALSNDHKPNLEGEKARVEAAGLKIREEKFMDNGKEMVIHKIVLSDDNVLATSRAFGDFEYKANTNLADEAQAVVALPEVVIQPRNATTDAYLVLASDGIWDVMSNEQVGQFVVENIASCTGDVVLPVVADRLLSKCLELGSTDNMSILIVALSKAAEKIALEIPERKALNFEPLS